MSITSIGQAEGLVQSREYYPNSLQNDNDPGPFGQKQGDVSVSFEQFKNHFHRLVAELQLLGKAVGSSLSFRNQTIDMQTLIAFVASLRQAISGCKSSKDEGLTCLVNLEQLTWQDCESMPLAELQIPQYEQTKHARSIKPRQYLKQVSLIDPVSENSLKLSASYRDKLRLIRSELQLRTNQVLQLRSELHNKNQLITRLKQNRVNAAATFLSESDSMKVLRQCQLMLEREQRKSSRFYLKLTQNKKQI